MRHPIPLTTMSDHREIERKLKQIEVLVGEVKRLIEAEDGPPLRSALTVVPESMATVPDWP